MKNTYKSYVKSFLLTGFLFFLSLALTGCGFFNQSPEANISTDPATSGGNVSVVITEKISFDGSNSSDPDGSISSFEWDFGNGDSKASESVEYAYDSEGNYQVTLTVTDDAGGRDTDTVTVNVSGIEPPPAPEGE